MRYRIVNRKRFIAACTVCLLIAACLLSAITSSIAAKDCEEESYISVRVKSGDTLYALARSYGNPKKDVREVVYDIKQLNGLDDALIFPGQELLIPEK